MSAAHTPIFTFLEEGRFWGFSPRRGHTLPGPNKTPFRVNEDELLWASEELLRETGQMHHVVRSRNELNVAKVASCISKFFPV